MSLARIGIGRFDEHQFLQSAGPQQGRVDEIRPVGGAEHHHIAARLDAVEFGQQGSHHAVGDTESKNSVPRHAASASDLVQEDQPAGAESRARRNSSGAQPFSDDPTHLSINSGRP